MKTTNNTNPFEFGTDSTASTESRRLDYTPALIEKSNQRASDLMIEVSNNPELHDLANRMMDNGNPQDLIDLIQAVYSEEQIKTDSTLLEGCDESQLSRLLESRRSDRSKAKKKGPRTNVQVCRTYISSMYAEMLIRKYWNKPYAGPSGSTSYDLEALAADQDALSRKVKSLQSKKSRLNKIAQFDESARAELEEVENEIARLNALRPTVRATAKVVVKDEQVDQLREIIKGLDLSTIPEDQQEKYLELIAKLG